MPQIQLDPEEVRRTGTDVKKKKEEMEEVVRRAKALMDNLKANFKGRRSQHVYEEWDRIYPGLTKSFETITQAGELLERAARDFEQADNA
jgi:WXG100 family type VII secretion target